VKGLRVGRRRSRRRGRRSCLNIGMVASLRYDFMRRKDCFGHVHVRSVIGKEQAKRVAIRVRRKSRVSESIRLEYILLDMRFRES
jgi:IS30 family transposase